MTGQTVISDSTTLISLARIGELELIQALFEKVLIPEGVFEEVTAACGDAPGAVEIAEAAWIRTEPADPQLIAPLLLRVDRGEAEAIALAQAAGDALLLTDDRMARRVAIEQGVEVLGTLGVLARAKGRGLIPVVRPLAERLQAASYRIDEALLEDVLTQLGE